jgi:hypothetical protein
MPLSDHEQQILQEIERQLYEHDPKFARGVAGASLHVRAARNVRRGVALFALGFVVLVAFFLHPIVLVGVAAFLLMLSGSIVAYHNARRSGVDRLKLFREDGRVGHLAAQIQRRIRGLRKPDDS